MKMNDIKPRYLYARVCPRYFEDAWVNGRQDDNDNPRMPLVKDYVWDITIDLSDGRVLYWPGGVSAATCYKVCDDGEYELLDERFEIISHKEGYVPKIMAFDEPGAGYGDYVYLKINPDGKIDGFPSGDILKEMLEELL